MENTAIENTTMENTVAVIIPVYKAHDTIQNTLHSIAMQRHISYKTYLVVDGEKSDHGEQGSYDYLKDFFDVKIYYMPENAGPGVARQYGIDMSTEPYISFIDADDTYLSSLALYYQHKPFKDDKVVIVSCDFLEEKRDFTVRLREKDMVWMHGKMYRRAFLDKYNIRFNETRANEDVGFNTQCQCYANENEQIMLSRDVTYMWQWRDNSTVRTDNNSYAYNESIDGYVTNKVYAFEKVLARQDIDDAIKFFIMKGQVHLFKKYLLAMLQAPKQVNHVKKHARKYYRALYKYIDKDYIDKAEKSIVASTGLREPEHYDEYIKFKELLAVNNRKQRRK